MEDFCLRHICYEICDAVKNKYYKLCSKSKQQKYFAVLNFLFIKSLQKNGLNRKSKRDKGEWQILF